MGCSHAIEDQTQSNVVINGNEYDNAQIECASNRVNNFIETHNRLPNFVTISENRVMINDFKPFMVDNGSSNDQNSNNSNNSNNDGTVINGHSYTAAQINDASNRVNNFIRTHNRLPNFVTISGRTVMINDFLPVMGDDVEEITRGTGATTLGRGQLNGLQGMSGLDTVANYIRRNLNHRLGSGTTAAIVERTGLGDCWGLSAWAAQVFYENGYSVRIEQGRTSQSSRHRRVQVLVNSRWIRFDPSAVTPRYNSVFGYSANWGSGYYTIQSFYH